MDILSELKKKSNRELGRFFNVSEKTIRRSKRTLFNSNITNPIVKGTVHRDDKGNVLESWERVGGLSIEQLTEILKEGFTCKANVSKVSKKPSNSKLLSVYPIGDAHIGLYAWGEESGEDMDCNKVEGLIWNGIEYLVKQAPEGGTGLILNLGDWFHTDTIENVTRKSGNHLDVDTRWSKVMRIGVSLMRRLIDLALTKHDQVVVRNVIGNHDEQSSLMLSITLKLFYENEPRVSVDDSPNAFWYFKFGKTLIGATHGDKTTPAKLPGIMANDQSENWGATKYRYWYTGHIHHKAVWEFPGCSVEAFRTVIGKDAWHHSHGYRSDRDLNCIVIDAELGEISRVRWSVR